MEWLEAKYSKGFCSHHCISITIGQFMTDRHTVNITETNMFNRCYRDYCYNKTFTQVCTVNYAQYYKATFHTTIALTKKKQCLRWLFLLDQHITAVPQKTGVQNENVSNKDYIYIYIY